MTHFAEQPWWPDEIALAREHLARGRSLGAIGLRLCRLSRDVDEALWIGLGLSPEVAAAEINRRQAAGSVYEATGEGFKAMRGQQGLLSRDEPCLAKSQQR
jgi:hypothetical protein